jgi:putative ABC transport system substrate-binding protein
MIEPSWMRRLLCFSDNRKSKIQNRKLVRTVALVVTLAMCEAVAQAQQPKKIARIGYLSERPAAQEKVLLPAFLQGLRDLGYTEGNNLFIEHRHTEAGRSEKLRDLAAELVRLKVDVIVAGGSAEAEAAKQATAMIPIVFAVNADPVGTGLVESLARPGGNVTGLSDFHGDLVAKRLELVKEVVPPASRIVFLWNSASSSGPPQFKQLQTAAPALGVTLLSFEVKRPDDFERAFAAMAKERPGALVVHGNPLLASHQSRIFEFAVKNRVPAIYTHVQWVEAGGLMSYGAHFPDLWRRAATYVDKILKGAKPADLPVEQPTKFEFIVNLKTAKQIGLTIPPNVLARADRVIK